MSLRDFKRQAMDAIHEWEDENSPLEIDPTHLDEVLTRVYEKVNGGAQVVETARELILAFQAAKHDGLVLSIPLLTALEQLEQHLQEKS